MMVDTTSQNATATSQNTRKGEGLILNNVTVQYRTAGVTSTALHGINMSVHPGEVVGLVGESGCGKSTTAKAICGLVPVTDGEVRYEGVAVDPLGFRKRPKTLQRIQMVFQNPYASLNPRRKIKAQLEDARAINEGTAPSVDELLDLVELPRESANLYPRQFSGGQRQRIAIARAMATGPSLLIGDEPIASLDASLQSKVAMLMKKVTRESGAAMLFISHDLSVVRLIVDRLYVMHEGRIVEEGETEEVWNHPKNRYTQRLLASIPIPDGSGTLPTVLE
ncbi:ABC transporter ATP-binding protein [Bifidobacterium sp. 82T10]|uniref:ABC transporter ATP-binding protein n=1 Tax=Bifidobacterium miconis TaxID=2834435 RepID=A0ABS6WDF4_9BIFI|nr:ATP-binding cassette domain-containing protein [Bifidobacterium miconis]MBW3092063.1 ABC transporter ATP-binding protein [Bifidobacterium miconis]